MQVPNTDIVLTEISTVADVYSKEELAGVCFRTRQPILCYCYEISVGDFKYVHLLMDMNYTSYPSKEI